VNQRGGRRARVRVPASATPKPGAARSRPAASFSADLAHGTASVSVPIALPAARGLEPELTLAYDSRAGNGLFGRGFTLDVPVFALDLSLGTPRYDGTDLVVHRGQQLVPLLRADGRGGWVHDDDPVTEDGVAYAVARMRPRVESDFTRIERWTAVATGETHWRTTSPDNVRSFFGRSAASRVADPADPRRVAEWLIDETRDPDGNRVVYGYAAEDATGVPDLPSERGRSIGANRYVSRISYGNYRTKGARGETFAFDVVFDYGQYDPQHPAAAPGAWTARADPFSTYAAGFERRMHRLCRGVLIFHRFPALANGAAALVRALRLTYDPSAACALLSAIDETGYRLRGDGTVAVRKRPAVRFTFSPLVTRTGAFAALTFAGAPVVTGALDAGRFELADLDGAGLPGIVQADADAARYWEPLGGGAYAPGRALPAFPVERDLTRGDVTLADVDADGRLDVELNSAGRSGFYRNDGAGGWEPFRPFDLAPVLAPGGAGELVDLDARGSVDYVVAEADALLVHRGLGVRGFDAPERVPRTIPLQTGGADEIARFANPFGDGRSHFVRVRDGSVEVWPNLGGGTFGAPVVLDGAPSFAGGLDARRLIFADLDGSGCDDIAYAYPDRVVIYPNANGNGFGAPVELPLPEAFDELARLATADVYGSGLATLVLSVARPGVRHYAFAPPVAAPAPYLLVRVDDDLGSTTEIAYRSSTAFALDDRAAGKPWPSPLGAPMHLVATVRATDNVTGLTTVRRIAYHDGYVDPVERVFCGFGCVERWDAETYDGSSPPARVVTWYDTSAPVPSDAVRRASYFPDPAAPVLAPSALDPAIGTDPDLQHEARFALHGRVLREEVYGEDGDPKAGVPFVVSESVADVRMLQPAGPNAHASFLVVQRETVDIRYERDAHDPRIGHTVALEVDAFGNVTRDCRIDYARRVAPAGGGGAPARNLQPGQTDLVAHVSSVRYVQPTDAAWFAGVACETTMHELIGIDPGADAYFTAATLRAALAAAFANAVEYGGLVGATPAARLVSWTRTLFWNDALDAACPLGASGAAGLEHHTENAVFPDALARARPLLTIPAAAAAQLDAKTVPAALRDALAGIGIRLDDAAVVTVVTATSSWSVDDPALGQRYLLALSGAAITVAERVAGDDAGAALTAAGYVLGDGGYRWNPGEVLTYAPEPERYHVAVAQGTPSAGTGSPLATATTFAYDDVALHVVAIAHVLDATTSLTTVLVPDYQALQPSSATDPNGIVSEILYDPLGDVVATSVHKGTAGDTPLAAYAERADASFESVLAHPELYLQGASTFAWTDLAAWRDRGVPVTTIALTRETHVSDLAPGASSAIAVAIAFHDGAGRVLQHKTAAEDGRWRVTGRTILDAKGLAVATYLPYFSATPAFDDPHAIIAAGTLATPTRFTYDAVGRGVRRDSPDGFFARYTYAAWWTLDEDENDTVLESAYYAAHANDASLSANARDALAKSVAQAGTPTLLCFDPRGRQIAIIATLLDTSGGKTVRRALAVRHELDDDGRILATTDPRGDAQTPPVKVLRRLYAMDSSVLLDLSTDGGVRVRIADVFGNPCYERDGRGAIVTKQYDALRRLTAIALRREGDPGAAKIVESLVYGETVAGAADRNLLGRVVTDRDQAGTVSFGGYDLGGRATSVQRQFVPAGDGAEIDWSDPAAVALDPDTFATSYAFDAVGRLVSETVPDGKRVVATFAVSGHLDTLSVVTPAKAALPIVTSQAADALGRTTTLALGNGATTAYAYDPLSARLTGIRTQRPPAGPSGTARDPVVHDHTVSYDAVGNVTRVRDAAPDTVFWNQQQVAALCDYRFDTLYRLVAATGRQQPGAGVPGRDPALLALRGAPPNDVVKLENYAETYGYDDASNLIGIAHAAASGGWSRAIVPQPWSNRLATVDGVATAADANGNVLGAGPVRGVTWSWRNTLESIATIAREDGGDDATVYRYDAGGRRVRATLSRRISDSETELVDTVYAGPFERKRIVRVTASGGTTILDRTALRVMDEPENEQASDETNRDAHAHADRVNLPHSAGRRAFATVYDWSLDARARETDAPGTPLTTFAVETHLGSIAIELDANADVITFEEYLPYGGTAFYAARSERDGVRKTYRFIGAERDASGLYAMGARWYAPWLGRWMSSDPAGMLGGLNTFLYCAANPVTLIDPRGLVPKKNNPIELHEKTRKKLSTARSALRRAESMVRTGKGLKLSDDAMAKRRQKVSEAKAKVRLFETQLAKYAKQVADLKKKAAKAKFPGTVPNKYNPGGSTERYVPITHPGPSAQYLHAGSISATHHVVDLYSTARSAAVNSAVRWYAHIINKQYLAPRGSVITVSPSSTAWGSSTVGAEASKIATKERNDANHAVSGTYAADEVVMHMPDSSISGVPYSVLPWMPGHKTANSIVGGGMRGGYTLSRIVVLETDGNHYIYQ
jgi:insecticidal toxin complex protein TccC